MQFRPIVTVSFVLIMAALASSVSPLTPPADGAQRQEVEVIPRQKFRSGEALTWTDVRIPTRGGVTQHFLIARPMRRVRAAVILFPGGKGTPIYHKRGESYRLGGNFLVRSSSAFARAGFMAAIADAPSDYESGMDDDFRASKAHLLDIRAVVDFLVKEGAERVFLIGTSRGTMSVGYLSTALKHPNVRGFVFTSSMDDISLFAHEEIETPILFVHHLDDGCHATTYSGAYANFLRFKKSTRKHFIKVSGGETPQSRACGALSEHGYLGMELETVAAIVKWLKGETPPGLVKP